MTNEEIKTYLTAMIKNLDTDVDPENKYMQGYIKCLEDTLQRIEE